MKRTGRRAMRWVALAALLAGGGARAGEDAAPEGERVFTVMSYNIHIGIGNDKQLDLERIARVIVEADPDFAGLQEVDAGSQRTAYGLQPWELARLTRRGVVYAHARPLDNGLPDQGPAHGSYGVAALAKVPLLVMEQFALPVPAGMEPRTALILRTRDGQRPLHFVVTHLPWERGPEHEALRVACIEEITRRVRAGGYLPVVLAADLNAAPDTDTLRALRRDWTVANDFHPQPTFSAAKPTRQIDYIAFMPQDGFEVISSATVDERMASDHLPLVAVLKERAAPASAR